MAIVGLFLLWFEVPIRNSSEISDEFLTNIFPTNMVYSDEFPTKLVYSSEIEICLGKKTA